MADDSDDSGSLFGLARGFRDRTLVTAKLATKVGLGFARRSLGGKSRVEDDDGDDASVEVAGDLVEQLGRLKGLVMKIGQIASYMPGTLPPRAQRVLTRLQAETTAMQWSTVREVLREDLGGEPDALFDTIATEPFAAASIGQVHRARHEGRDVAVKIQYPGIEDVLRQDLKAAAVLAKLGMMGSDLDAKALMAELRERMLEECDYRLEARHQSAFGRLLAHIEGARVPEVIEGRSGRRVLTSALDPGQSFYPFCESATQGVRDRAGAIVFAVSMGSIFRHAAFNGDPHPGNYLFAPDGSVTFLDFGCVRRFDPEMIGAWKDVARATLDGDRARFVEHYPRLGFVKRPDKFDWDHQWSMMRYLYRPFIATEPFEYTHDYVRESYSLMIFDNPNRFRTAMPPAWLLLNRLQWGLTSVLAHLGSRVRWGEIMREIVDAPTAAVSL
jgi:predicted unusual protein kinase regulating ubiquinone biosynthesis (AarF/ABC1/UbiB family)